MRSPALRSNCSRNNGLPPARSTHCVAKASASIKRRAIDSASTGDSGERSMVIRAAPPARAAPMSVQRIAFETRRHRQNAAARGRRASDRRKKAERLRVGPMDVLHRDEQRLAIRRSLNQLGDDTLLALRPGRRIHCFIEPAGRLRLRNLEQIAQVERIVGLRASAPAKPYRLRLRQGRTKPADPKPMSPATTVRTAPCPRSVPKSRTKPEWLVMPDAAATDCSSSISRVLPIPASPRIRMTAPDGPSMHASRTARK